jgi:hypothetical protein
MFWCALFRVSTADALLALVLQTLAQDTPLHRAAFIVLFPIAKLQETVMEIQDHWAILEYVLFWVFDFFRTFGLEANFQSQT